MKQTFLFLFILLSQETFGTELLNLKKQIIQISEQNMNRLDNFSVIRKKLDPLVKKLGQLQSLTPEDSKKLKVGVWKQLWTDDADDLRANNRFQTAERDQTYQVVFADGVFYNLTVINTPIGPASGFLRGIYEQNKKAPEYLDLRFTSLRLKKGGLPSSSNDILDLTLDVENGYQKTFSLPFGFDKYPNGPVGAKGDIKTVYIDQFLRIDVGRNQADQVEDLFVLIKLY